MYGRVPQFKAGAHVGTVVVTEIGNFKKELVYHGEVVNTVSEDLAAAWDQFEESEEKETEDTDEVEL